MKSHEQFYEFMNNYTLGVISTVGEDKLPHSAIVGFGQTKDLKILFGTDNYSLKYKNLQADPHVAFVIGGETNETVQIEGTARELKPEELDLVSENYWKKNSHAKVHHKNTGERYFIITPTWMRYTDLRIKPWDITEIKFWPRPQWPAISPHNLKLIYIVDYAIIVNYEL